MPNEPAAPVTPNQPPAPLQASPPPPPIALEQDRNGLQAYLPPGAEWLPLNADYLS